MDTGHVYIIKFLGRQNWEDNQATEKFRVEERTWGNSDELILVSVAITEDQRPGSL